MAAVHKEAVVGLVGAETDVIGDHFIGFARLGGVRNGVFDGYRHIADAVECDENVGHVGRHDENEGEDYYQKNFQDLFERFHFAHPFWFIM